ncbi:DUF300-domain-containing protein [Xylariomycetidae sp. FL0641]|nr:DUF300-domain-containing protein [Xylariomycetidae sp. FL0641]
MNLTCNSTLEDLRIGSEEKLVGPLTFHQLALIIAALSTIVCYVVSFYLMAMHAMNYTRPREQKHIIRILFMVPIYATSSFLSIYFYWNAVYYQVLSECYEAFAIASFFALMCHYLAPDLHEQKEFFRHLHPIKDWVWPVNWIAKCCGGQRGPWRTPKSGLTWFNVIWIGVYHYCFIRVAMTITAVVTEYYERYCESSNSPVFAHIWVIAIESIAVTIAMFCLIQFYVQLREQLAEHKPFLKVLAIKLVIFLSFWQSIAISVGTSTLHLVNPNAVLAYPDIKVGIPSLLLCIEMAIFAILHLWAFPYSPYIIGTKPTFYPSPTETTGFTARENEHGPNTGGFGGIKAFGDALNIWDVIKAFGRGMRWLFVGVKHRHKDTSYQKDGDTSYPMNSFDPGAKSTEHLPIATQFRRSAFGVPTAPVERERAPEEAVGLIANAQPNPGSASARAASPYHDSSRQQSYDETHIPKAPAPSQGYGHYDDDRGDIGAMSPHHEYSDPDGASVYGPTSPANRRTSTQRTVGSALWAGQNPPASHYPQEAYYPGSPQYSGEAHFREEPEPHYPQGVHHSQRGPFADGGPL